MELDINSALLSAQFFLSSRVGINETGFDTNCKLEKTPIEIFDINKKILFYDFYIKSNNGIVASIRCAANKGVGDPIVSYTHNPFDPNVDKLLISKNFSSNNTTVIKSCYTCYAYPKVGVEIEWQESIKTTTLRSLFDPYSLELLDKDISSWENQTPINEADGYFYISYFDWIPEGGEQELYEQRINVIKRITERATKTQLSAKQRTALEKTSYKISDYDFDNLSDYFIKNKPAQRIISMPVQLIGQETKDYCALASAQMLLSYYNKQFTQQQLIVPMGYHTGGTSQKDQVNGYKQLLGDKFKIIYDREPAWEKSVAEINSNRPFKSGIFCHARVCAGYQILIYLDPETRSPIREEHYLLIHDPLPENHGHIYWELFDKQTYYNTITINLS